MFKWKLQTVIFYIMSVALIKKKKKKQPYSCRTKETPENSGKTALLIIFLLTSFLQTHASKKFYVFLLIYQEN